VFIDHPCGCLHILHRCPQLKDKTVVTSFQPGQQLDAAAMFKVCAASAWS
jgi:hypothetical protein